MRLSSRFVDGKLLYAFSSSVVRFAQYALRRLPWVTHDRHVKLHAYIHVSAIGRLENTYYSNRTRKISGSMQSW